jgi:N,N'-diacetyllegionaminate synthase
MNSSYLIAEMACSHEGDVDIAKIIISAAGKAKANAIQFQIWKLSLVDTPDHPDYKMRSSVELSFKDWELLYKFSRENFPKMDIIACIYEEDSLAFCNDLGIDAFKIHGMDISNPYLLKKLAQTGKRIDLSVGGSSLDEITRAIHWIKSANSKSEIWLMYGLQSFPTDIKDANLAYMSKLKDLFELPVGYQDHCDGDSEAGFWLPAAAVGLGVNIIEKHITHDRSFKGVDHQAALNPDEFEKFAKMLLYINDGIGRSTPSEFSEAELQYRKYARKSIVFNRNISKGESISLSDLNFLRAPQNGISPSAVDDLIGKKLLHNRSKFDLVSLKDLS